MQFRPPKNNVNLAPSFPFTQALATFVRFIMIHNSQNDTSKNSYCRFLTNNGKYLFGTGIEQCISERENNNPNQGELK
jgi:hypothetical protein